MSETLPQKLIPNCVGRLDPVMDALRVYDFDEVDRLLIAELDRRKAKWQEYTRLALEEAFLNTEIRDFRTWLLDSEFRIQAAKESQS
jgi:hypothetical protein